MNITRHFAFFLTLFLLSACSQNTPEGVANEYWQAMFADEEETITKIMLDKEASGLHKTLDPGSESKIVFGDTYIDGDTAKIDTMLTWKNSKEESTFATKTILIRTNEGWKIDTEQTQKVFFNSVYASTLTGLEAALVNSANAFLELGDSLTDSMADELSNATRKLQQQSEAANQEIQEFLKNLDVNLQQELEKY